jgi:hypothetical protein
MILNVKGDSYRCCDGLTRRGMLKAGFLAFGGLTLPDLLRRQAMAAEAGQQAKDMSVILIWQGGGPSHMDMWDLKPSAPSEYRGSFGSIPTSVKGYEVSEHMPKIARVCDKLSIIRSTTHEDSGHESASHFLLTGYKPTNDIPAQEMPSYGSIVGKEMGPRTPSFPAYVTIPTAPRSAAAAYLGVAHNPFETHGDPNSDQFNVQNMTLPGGVSLERMQNRRAVLQRFDTLRRDADAAGNIAGMDSFYQQAFDMVTSPAVQKAFDMSQETAELRQKYGRDKWGQSCLLARRLVEAGVRFVTVDMGGWDTHANNFEELKNGKLASFDRSFAALVQDLADRGRLQNTLVLVWGEFGRTPRINDKAGRDHWPNVFTTLMAGGGLRPTVLGTSDSKAEYPKDRPVSPQDVLATMYRQLGIDRTKSYINEAARPVEILNYGEPIRELI